MITIPIRKRAILQTKQVITRNVPKGALVEVSIGQEVTPETVLARYEVSAGFCIFHLKTLIGLSGGKLASCLQKQPGQRVYTNEIIATTAGFLPFQKKQFASPVDGTIVSITENGDLTISLLPQKEAQAALVWGRVVAITQNSPKTQDERFALDSDATRIAIETNCLQIFGVMGSGREREGRLLLACGNNEFLLPQKFDESYKDAVVVCGSLADHNLLTRAVMIQTSGIIAGGAHFKDAAAMGIRTSEGQGIGTDTGVSLVVIEGFGSVGINPELYDLIAPYHGRFVLISGNTQTVTIPLKQDERPALYRPTDVPNQELRKGQLVRITAGPDLGKIGTVESIGVKLARLPSGIVATPVMVALNLALTNNFEDQTRQNSPQPVPMPVVEPTTVEVPSENLERVVYV